MFAWGNRATIINKSTELLMQLMNNEPHEFCTGIFGGGFKNCFKHRTFNATDLLYFVSFFHMHYRKYPSLETAFTQWMNGETETVENRTEWISPLFFLAADVPNGPETHRSAGKKFFLQTAEHVPALDGKFRDSNGVDFGIWKISTRRNWSARWMCT